METFVNDSVKLNIDTTIDMNIYTTLTIKYKKPDRTTGCWIATVCPLDNTHMVYTCAYGDLDMPGRWLFQAIVKDVGIKLTGRWFEIMIYDPLSEFCTTLAPTTMVPTTTT